MTLMQLQSIFYGLKPIHCVVCGISTDFIYSTIEGTAGCAQCIDEDQLKYDFYINTIWQESNWYYNRIVITNIETARYYTGPWVPNTIRNTIRDHIYKHKL